MATQFTCKNPGRRRALLDLKKLNGIDFLEVVSADQRTLEVSFLFPLPPAPGSTPAAPIFVLLYTPLRRWRYAGITARSQAVRHGALDPISHVRSVPR